MALDTDILATAMAARTVTKLLLDSAMNMIHFYLYLS